MTKPHEPPDDDSESEETQIFDSNKYAKLAERALRRPTTPSVDPDPQPTVVVVIQVPPEAIPAARGRREKIANARTEPIPTLRRDALPDPPRPVALADRSAAASADTIVALVADPPIAAELEASLTAADLDLPTNPRTQLDRPELRAVIEQLETDPMASPLDKMVDHRSTAPMVPVPTDNVPDDPLGVRIHVYTPPARTTPIPSADDHDREASAQRPAARVPGSPLRDPPARTSSPAVLAGYGRAVAPTAARGRAPYPRAPSRGGLIWLWAALVVGAIAGTVAAAIWYLAG